MTPSTSPTFQDSSPSIICDLAEEQYLIHEISKPDAWCWRTDHHDDLDKLFESLGDPREFFTYKGWANRFLEKITPAEESMGERTRACLSGHSFSSPSAPNLQPASPSSIRTPSLCLTSSIGSSASPSPEPRRQVRKNSRKTPARRPRKKQRNQPKRSKSRHWNKVYIHLESVELHKGSCYTWRQRGKIWSDDRNSLSLEDLLVSWKEKRSFLSSVRVRPRGDGFAIDLRWCEEEGTYVAYDAVWERFLKVDDKKMQDLLKCPNRSVFITKEN